MAIESGSRCLVATRIKAKKKYVLALVIISETLLKRLISANEKWVKTCLDPRTLLK